MISKTTLLFKPYDHINNLSVPKEVKIKVYLAESDNVISFIHREKLVKKMKELNLKIKIKKTFLKHAMSILKSVALVG